MKIDRVLSKDVVRTCNDFRRAIWDQEEIEGMYKVIGLTYVSIEDRPDAVIQLKKDDGIHLVMMASEFIMSILSRDIDSFNYSRSERIMDTCSIHDDFVLPEFFEVLGKHETQGFAEDNIIRTLIIKNN